MKRPAAILFLSLALLIAAMALKSELLTLPDPANEAETGSFDTARSLARLQRILGDQRPHPVDSEPNDAVRERLLAELRSIGLEPVVTDDFTCNGGSKTRTISCARIRNIVATIGPRSGKHLLLVSHYDSTPTGPGASDDGIGVASMLETAFLLKQQNLRRPVTFLFDEGEEVGLIGARAFLDSNPIADKVDSLINLESRGVTGPAIMFETSRPNGAALAAFSRSASRPVANSATTDFYKLIPNSTDVAVFDERKDWTILNFAVIGNETRYHSSGDNLAALDRRSVAHMGGQTLALARTLAVEGAPAVGGDRLYADIASRFLIDFPILFPTPLLFLPLIAMFGYTSWSRRGGNRRSAGTIVAALAGSTAAAFVGHSILGLIRPGAWWRAHPEAAGAAIYVTAAAICLLVIMLLARPVARDRLRAAYWLIFVAAGTLISLAAPGAAIYFLAPPLIALAGMALERRLPGSETAMALLAWLSIFITWTPLLDLTEILLDFDTAWLFAPLAGLVLLPALIELKPTAARLPLRPLAAALAILFLLGWVPALLAPAYSPNRKQEFGIEYAWHSTDKAARWMVVHDGGRLPAEFEALGRFEHGVKAPWSTRRRWAIEAAAIPIEPPGLDQLARGAQGAIRRVTLRLLPNGAETVRLRLPPDSRLIGVTTGGRTRRFGSGKVDEHYVLRCHGRACDGRVFELAIQTPYKVAAEIMGIRTGLPAEGARLVAARPANASPQYNPDSSIAIRRVEF